MKNTHNKFITEKEFDAGMKELDDFENRQK